MLAISELQCLRCGSSRDFRFPCYRCDCGGNLWVEMDFTAVANSADLRAWSRNARSASVADWANLLPVDRSWEWPIGLSIGPSPLHWFDSVARQAGLARVGLKDDTRLPSCSFKDRGSSVVVAQAVGFGLGTVITASTGNAGCSLACLCASAGIQAVVLVPKAAPPAKVAQLQMFGARVVLVDGNYDDAFALSFEVSARTGWLNRSTGWNPFTREGKKTVSFEIAAQMNFDVPDYVFVSTGDGNILSGVYKGFYDLKKAGLTRSMPRLVAVQSSGSNAMALALANRRRGLSREDAIVAVSATTRADSISVDLPRDADGALTALESTDGWVEVVDDSRILAAIPAVAAGHGVFLEPAGAAAWAGFLASIERGALATGARVVVLGTGNGLKDPMAAVGHLPEPWLVPKSEQGGTERLLELLSRQRPVC